MQKRREERKKLEQKIEENRDADTNTDTKETNGCFLEISEEGKVLLKGDTGLDSAGSDEIKTDAVKEPVTYTKTGGTVPIEREASISVFV